MKADVCVILIFSISNFSIIFSTKYLDIFNLQPRKFLQFLVILTRFSKTNDRDL